MTTPPPNNNAPAPGDAGAEEPVYPDFGPHASEPVAQHVYDALGLETETGEIRELRCFRPLHDENGELVLGAGGRPQTEKWRWRAADRYQLACHADEASALGFQVYRTLNPLQPEVLPNLPLDRPDQPWGPSASANDVLRRTHLFVDVEAERPSGTSATDEEVDAARDLLDVLAVELRAAGWPWPLRRSSGNGCHGLYRVDLPADDGGLVERALAALAARHPGGPAKVDTTVADANRLIRLAGTVNRKGEATAERPHRLCTLNDPGDAVVVRTPLIAGLAAEAPTVVAGAGQTVGRGAGGAVRGGGGRPRTRAALDRFMATFLPDADGPRPYRDGGRLWVLPVCPWNPLHDDRAAFVLQFAGGGVHAGCHHNGCSGRGWRDLERLFAPGGPSAPVPPSVARANARNRR
ncbi:hypothetical protein [Alienimonas sp. DA493]|uniref:hypothetical protein n=1 Tax=Alienimonas sp. DA493 TaxID=3373605 RepID=UPI003754CF7E